MPAERLVRSVLGGVIGLARAIAHFHLERLELQSQHARYLGQIGWLKLLQVRGDDGRSIVAERREM